MNTAGDVTAAHAGHAAEAPPDEVDDAPHAWLWRVSGGDAAAPSYVLGTFHIGVILRRALPPSLDENLYASRAVVMEIDPREADAVLRGGPRRRRGAPRAQWLDRSLPAPVWQLLVAELGDRVPAELLRQVPPGAIHNHLMQVRMAEVEALEDGREPVRGAASTARLDMSIFDWAVRSGRPVVPLETPEQAIAALEALDRGGAIEALRRIVEQAEDARGQARQLREAYLGFDEAAMLALLTSMQTPNEREIMLLGRNRAWMENLLPQIREGNAFVAVGLFHLIGDDSVLEMLAERGYTIERVVGTGTPAQGGGSGHAVAY
jgi:uncharacterized protein YbaP (TraB family)